MSKCNFCHHENPAGAERCTNCGAWISQGAPATPRDPEPEQPAPPATEVARPDPESLEGRVLALMESGQKIAAIKVYREATGSGLKDAKDAVEALAARHGVRAKVAGCSVAVGMLLVAISTLALGMAW